MYSIEYKKITKQLIVKLAISAVFCLGIISVIAVIIGRKNTEVIEEVGDMYMHSISEEIALHFKTTIDSQCNVLVDLLAAEKARNLDGAEVKEWLAEGAGLRNLEYLALVAEDGTMETLYGEDLEIDDARGFLESLRSGEQRIALGTGESGNKVMLIGIPSAELTGMDDTYVAIISGVKMDFINETLGLDVSEAAVYSHIIRLDGDFIIRNGEAFRNNYFERMDGEMEEGKARRYIDGMKSAMQEGVHYSAILEMEKEDRHIHVTELPYADWFLVVVMPYSSADMDISRLSSMSSNITYAGGVVILFILFLVFWFYFRDLKRLMVELDHVRQDAVDANKSKSDFLSNMSHDIRTPLNAIVGMTSIATVNIDNKEQVRDCLKKITISSKHLLGLINDVLDISKIESGKMTLAVNQVSLREIVENVVTIIQPQADAKRQNFEVVIHDIFSEDVCCDSMRLNQALINILGNAVKFTPEGGTIRVSVYEENCEKEDSIITHIVAEDTGIGMTQEFQEKIFDSFSRANSRQVDHIEGSGLGMAITKYIVDAMDGTIEVQSELGKGTRFHIVLELKKAYISEKNMSLPNWRTLVIDDDREVCESTVSTLKELGVDAEWVLDAETAIQMIQQQHEKDEYKILLVDWKLPQMDGVDFAREIRLRYGEEIPIMLISAYDWSGIEDKAREAGITGFILKPLFKSTLYHRLKPLILGGEENAAEPQEDRMDFSGKRILLAEDNELNWEIAKEILSSMGLEVEWAKDGQVCIDKFKQSAAGYYDMILMDVRMPVMNGYEACEAIRAMDRADAQEIPIIAMTADAFAEDIKKCLDSGMNAHIAKPIEVNMLTRQLIKYLG